MVRKKTLLGLLFSLCLLGIAIPQVYGSESDNQHVFNKGDNKYYFNWNDDENVIYNKKTGKKEEEIFSIIIKDKENSRAILKFNQKNQYYFAPKKQLFESKDEKNRNLFLPLYCKKENIFKDDDNNLYVP